MEIKMKIKPTINLQWMEGFFAGMRKGADFTHKQLIYLIMKKYNLEKISLSMDDIVHCGDPDNIEEQSNISSRTIHYRITNND